MANNFGSMVVKLIADAAQFRSEFSKAVAGAESAMGKIGSAVGGLKSKLAALGVGVSFGALFTESVKAAMEAEQASARLDAVLKATGHSAGLTKKELDGMADAMSKSTQFDDEAIRGASAELLKFGNIQGDVFRDALKLSADVAAFNGEDVAASAQSIGKALLDVETASKLLKTAGVALSEQQKDQIKTFIDAGDSAKAQQLVLELLKKTYDGMADSLNTGLTKSTKDAAKAWDELLESIGRTGAATKGTSTFLSGVTFSLEKLKDLVDGFDQDKLEAILVKSGAKPLSPMPGFSGVSGKDMFAGKTLEDVQAASGAAAKKKYLDAEADYARQKKLAEEGKKHAKELADLTKKQRRAMQASDQWAADSYTEQLQEANKAQSEWAQAAGDTARSFVDMISPADEMVRKMQTVEFLMETINKETGQPFLSADQGQLALLNLNEQIDDLNKVKDAGADTFADLTRAVEGWGNAFTDTMADMAMTGKLEFGAMADSILRDLLRMSIKKNITDKLFDSFKSGDFMSSISNFFTPSANGNVFSSPGLSAYSGSIVSRPTVFPFASGIGLMGEAGAEAILPLKRTSNGKLGVEADGMGGTVNVVVNNNASGTEARVETRQEGGAKFIEIIIDKVENTIWGNVARGSGSGAAVLAKTYGLNRVAGAY